MKKILTILIATLTGLTSYSQPERPKLPAELKEQADAIKASVEAGEITHDQAKAKIKELLEQNKPDVGGEKPEVEIEIAQEGDRKRPQRPEKPEISDELKAQIESVRELEKAIHSEIKARVEALGNEATQEEIKATVEAFKESNKDRFEEIKEAHSAIKEDMIANRPEKPERPELTEELKVKVEALHSARKEMHEAQKELRETLKDASEEERKEAITAFKEANKAKHEEIKSQAKEVNEEIRALVETEATRTSDL